MTQNFIIVDLDGTLADCSHRVHLAQAGLWDEFNAACPEDKPIPSTVTLLDNIDPDITLIAVTGRSAKFRKQTEAWLMAHVPGAIDEVLMRPEHVFRPDHEVKIELLEAKFGSKEEVLKNVLLVLEDRDKVVAALRDYGLVVWQVQVGSF